jgi:hypothetical protein
MNDHDFGGYGVDDLYRLIHDLANIPDAMSWSPRWQDRTGDAAPMRSHP